MTVVALDTSVAVPLLVQPHRDHADVVRWWNGRDVALAGHALIETYSVLTRLPGDLRVEPADAARLLTARFSPPILLPDADAAEVPDTLARLGIAGGAAYDALVALAAAHRGVGLATRDARAVATYQQVGVEVITVG